MPKKKKATVATTAPRARRTTSSKKTINAVSKKPRVSRATTPPFPEYPEWSTAKFWAFVRSGLRAKWTRWPPKYAIMASGKRAYTGTNKRQKFEYHCQGCDGWFPQKEIQCDHIVPTGTLKCFEDLPAFCERLFVGVDKLQRLCTTCHAAKTATERKERNLEDSAA